MQKISQDPSHGLLSPKSSKKDKNLIRAVEIHQMFQVLSITLIGIILSGMIIIGEMIHNRKFVLLKRTNKSA